MYTAKIIRARKLYSHLSHNHALEAFKENPKGPKWIKMHVNEYILKNKFQNYLQITKYLKIS